MTQQRLEILAEFKDTRDGTITRVIKIHPHCEYLVRRYDAAGKWIKSSDWFTFTERDALNYAGEEHPDMVRIK